MRQKIKCFFGLHPYKYFVENLITENSRILTIGSCQCNKCGKSKINFIFGN